MSIYQDILTGSGEHCLQLVREYERTACTIADYRNLLRFLLRCLQNGLIPKDMVMKCPIKTRRAEKVIRNCLKGLLNERVRQMNETIDASEAEEEQILDRLRSCLDETTLQRVVEHTDKARLAYHECTTAMQRRKFDDLLLGQSRRQTSYGASSSRRGCVRKKHAVGEDPEVEQLQTEVLVWHIGVQAQSSGIDRDQEEDRPTHDDE